MIRSFAVTSQVELLLAYADAGTTIVNTATDQSSVIYVGQSPSTSSTNGFPVNALSSTQTTKAGPVYAVLSSLSVVNTVTVLASDELQNYDNPIALASAVAASIAATGVPNVLVEDVISANQLLPVNSPKTFDVRKYGTVMIVGRDSIQPILYEFISDAGQIIDRDIFVPILNGTQLPVRIQVTAPILRLTNFVLTGTDSHVDILASNRNALERLDGRSLSAGVAVWTGAAPAVGNDVLLTINDVQRQHQGLCYANFSVSSTTITGYFFAQDVTAVASGFIILCDTAEMNTGYSSTGGKFVSKQVALPLGAEIWFHCTTNTGGAIAARFTPTSLS